MLDNFMFFIDFDGTISSQDFCAAMVMKYARDGWEELNRLWEKKLISTEECARRTLELIDTDPEELEAFFKTVTIDPTFQTFISWADSNDFPIYVLSDGYDNYIKEAFALNGISLPYYANHMEFEKGWKINCSYSDSECQLCGVCKTGLIKRLAKTGYRIVYIGDGYSDICPAEYSDMVFAKNDLAHLCQDKTIPYFQYKDFSDVIRIMEKAGLK